MESSDSSPRSPKRVPDNGEVAVRPLAASSPSPSDTPPGQFWRYGSVREKSIRMLQRMGSLKSGRKQTTPQRERGPVVIGEPLVQDDSSMQARMEQLQCVDITPTDSSSNPSPEFQLRLSASPELSARLSQTLPPEDSSSQSPSDRSVGNTPLVTKPHRARRSFRKNKRFNSTQGCLSDSECSPPPWRESRKDANSNLTDLLGVVDPTSPKFVYKKLELLDPQYVPPRKETPPKKPARRSGSFRETGSFKDKLGLSLKSGEIRLFFYEFELKWKPYSPVPKRKPNSIKI